MLGHFPYVNIIHQDFAAQPHPDGHGDTFGDGHWHTAAHAHLDGYGDGCNHCNIYQDPAARAKRDGHAHGDGKRHAAAWAERDGYAHSDELSYLGSNGNGHTIAHPERHSNRDAVCCPPSFDCEHHR